MSQPRRSRACRALALSIWPIAFAACERPAPRSQEDSGVAVPPAAASADSAPSSSDAGGECPETGLWRECSLEKRLERAGFVAARQEAEVRHAFLDIPGRSYMLAGDELQVFIYPSAEARERDLSDLDSATVAPPGEDVGWAEPPTLIVSNNLAAILIGGSSRQIERVQLALTAGLPRP
jgi:hypothetical protein